MAKSQSFADKVARHGGSSRKLARLVIAVKKENGHFSFKSRMVDSEDVKQELQKFKS
jgi:hypothetical protein